MDAYDQYRTYERKALRWWLAENPEYEGYLWKNIVIDKMIDPVLTFHKALRLIKSNRSVEQEYGFDAIALHRTTKEPVFLQFKTSQASNALKADRFATFMIALISMNHVVEQETGVKAFVRSVIVSDTPVAATFREFSAVFLKTEFHVVSEFPTGPGPLVAVKPRVKDMVLRDDQCIAVNSLQNFKGRLGLVEAPGGWGKSVVMAEYLRGLPNKTACVVAPTKALCRQLEGVLKKRGVSGVVRVTSDTTSDVEERLEHVLGGVIVVTNDTYRTVLISRRFDVVVFDEGHNFRSTITFPDAHRQLIFFTATPPAANEWACQGNVETVYRKSFADAVSDNIVLAPEIVVPIAKDGAVLSQDRNDAVELAKYVLEQAIRGGDDRAVVFVKSCAFGTHVVNRLHDIHKSYKSELYLGRDLEAALVRDSTPQARRDVLQKSFGKDPDKIYVLVSVRILAEGIDLPPCNSVVVYEPGAWSFIKKQMVFRGSRKDPARPHKITRIHLFAPDGSGPSGVTVMSDIIHALGVPTTIRTRAVGRLDVESEEDQDAIDCVEASSHDAITVDVTNDMSNAALRASGEEEGGDGTSQLDAVSAEALMWRRLNDLKAFFEEKGREPLRKDKTRTSDGGVLLYNFRVWCTNRSRRHPWYLGHRPDVRDFVEAFDHAFYKPTLGMKVDSARRLLEMNGTICKADISPLYHDDGGETETVHTKEWACGAWVRNMKQRDRKSAMWNASDDDIAKFKQLEADYPTLFRVTTVADMAVTLRRFIALNGNSLESINQRTRAPLWASIGGEDVELEPGFKIGDWVHRLTRSYTKGFDPEDPSHVAAWEWIADLVEQYPHKFWGWHKADSDQNSGKRKRDV